MMLSNVRSRLNRSISLKLTTGFVAVLLVLVAFSSIYYPLQQQKQGFDRANATVGLLADMLSFSIGAGLSEGNLELVQAAMNWAKEDSSVVYLAALDADSELLSEYNPRSLQVGQDVQKGKVDWRKADGEVTVTRDISYKDQSLGKIVIVYSLDAMNHEIRAMILLAVLVNIVLATLCIGLIVLVLRKMVRAVASLRDASQKVAGGDLDQEVDTQREDELGDLARSISDMIAKLRLDRQSAATTIESSTEVVREINRTVEYLKRGELNQRTKCERAEGEFRRVVEGFNEALEAIVSPLTEAAVVLKAAAAKDLTRQVDGDYQGQLAELKADINGMIRSLDDALTQVAGSAQRVQAASEHIAGGSRDLAVGAQRQAASLEEISSSLQEVSSMSNQNTSHAREARALADAARQGAAHGMESMGRLSEAMEQIKGASDKTARIVRTIDEIAFQTNLLALNAAVEAARAGDAGKGFAVVAEEVRNLATRSAQAARNTSDLIEESVKRAEEGVVYNREVLANLQEINGIVQKVSEGIADITAASEQQSLGIEQVNGAMESLNQVTQQAAASAEESVSASEELSSSAQEMNRLVSTFRTTKAGNAHAEPAWRSSDPSEDQAGWRKAG
jgi:methyl-accepting chemotaxis protein